MKKAILRIVGIVALLLLGSASANAGVWKLSYFGNPFRFTVDNNPPAGNYDTTMSITGSLTLTDPFFNIPSTDITPYLLGYSFTDGRQTLDSTNSKIGGFGLFLTTDGAGLPTAWNIQLLVDPTFVQVGDILREINTTNSFDIARISRCDAVDAFGRCTATSDDNASNFSNPGRWTITHIPEPSTLPLILVGLAILCLSARRRAQTYRIRL